MRAPPRHDYGRLTLAIENTTATSAHDGHLPHVDMRVFTVAHGSTEASGFAARKLFGHFRPRPGFAAAQVMSRAIGARKGIQAAAMTLFPLDASSIYFASRRKSFSSAAIFSRDII